MNEQKINNKENTINLNKTKGQIDCIVINFLQDNSKEIKLCYGIGRYTNASRSAIRHIADSDGKPLCGSRKKFTYETESGERKDVDCKKCRQKYL
jgi:hypothetical protein